VTSKKESKNTENYWLNKNTLDRFVGMQVGHFMLHDSAGTKPTIMGSGDSLFVYTAQFSNPNKDDIWLYQKMYMSSFPEKPLHLTFLKVKKTNTDSIFVEEFSLDDTKPFINADKDPSLLNQLDFQLLHSINCDMNFIKETQLKFVSKTAICEVPLDLGHLQIYTNEFVVEPNNIYVRTTYYEKENGQYKYKNEGKAYLIRTPKK
jgi:hypothetical protein